LVLNVYTGSAQYRLGRRLFWSPCRRTGGRGVVVRLDDGPDHEPLAHTTEVDDQLQVLVRRKELRQFAFLCRPARDRILREPDRLAEVW
jgi:hypothetical protein